MMKISRVLSTQHPDNVTIPFFAENSVMNGDDEVKEAFHVFSDLGIDEQLWDAEGKEVDNFVVKKLLAKHQDYFQKTVLGEDKFLTLRVPNPEVEKDEGKILLETLHSIPRNADLGMECNVSNRIFPSSFSTSGLGTLSVRNLSSPKTVFWK